MKKLLLCLAVILGFGLTAAAQNSGAVTALTASNPANGGFVSELPDAVTLTFGNATRVTESDDIETYDDFFTSMSLAGKSLNPGSVVGNYRISGNTVVFHTSLRNQSVSDGDVFTFTLAPGALKADGQNISLTYSFTIGTDPAALKYTASNPQNGSNVPALPTSFVLTFGDATSVAVANAEDFNVEAYNDDTLVEGMFLGNPIVNGNAIEFPIERMASMYLTGNVRFHFPDGALLVDGASVPAFDYGFNIKADEPQPGGDAKVTFIPANGAILSEIQTVIISTSPAISSIEDGIATLTRTYKGETTQVLTNDYMLSYFLTEDGTNGPVGIKLPKQTAPGVYTMTWDEGMFILGSASVGNSPKYTATWTIPDNIITLQSVLNYMYPGDNDLKEWWYDNTATFSMEIKGAVTENPDAGDITLTVGNKTYKGKVQMADNEDGTYMVQVGFSDVTEIGAKIAPGTYTFTIPGGYFSSDGKPIAPFTKSWEVFAEPEAFKYEWAPKVGDVDLSVSGDGISSSNKLITIKFPNTFNLELAGKSDIKAQLIYDATEEVIAEFSSVESEQDLQMQRDNWNFNIRNAAVDQNKYGKGIDVNGKYTLKLPQGFFVSETGVPNAAASFSWTLKGGVDPDVQQVFTFSPEPGAYDVFPTVTLTYENCTKIVLSNTAVGHVFLTNNEIGLCKVTTDGVNKVTFTPTRDIRDQAPSEFSYYALKADAGIFTLTINGTDVENTAIDIAKVYTIKEPTPAPLVLDPADGAQVTSGELQTITVTTTETITVNPMKYGRLYPVVDGVRSAEPIASYRLAVPAGTNEGTYTITAETEIPEGIYDFVIPAEQYRVTIEGRARQSKEQVARYYVGVAAPKDYTFVTDPADGATVNAPLTDIFVTPEGASSIEVLLPLKLTKGQVSYDIVGVVAENKANYMIVTQEITAGEWTATVPANGLKIDGEVYAKEISWKFTVADGSAAEMPKPAANPAEGQVSPEQLDEIILTPADGAKATKLGEDDTYLITLSPVTDGVAGISVRTYTASINEEGQVVLKVQGTDLPALEKGDYRLNVMANSFFIGEQGNPVFDFDYKVVSNSVDAVYGNDTEFNVYTATGIVVVRNGNADDVNALAPGLYIINGKKVLIRK